MDALYIIGEPGVGKSTLVEHLTRDLPFEETDSPFPMRVYDCGVTELGRRRPEFSGTDALGMAVQPKVEAYLEGMKPGLLLAEGDRLANEKFFVALQRFGYQLHVVALIGMGAAAKRRLERGSKQDVSWLRGRQTKVRNLIESWATAGLDATQPVEELAAALEDPVSHRLKLAREGVPA